MKIDTSVISELSTSGVYTLLLFVSKQVTLTIGKLGKQTFANGYYIYTGSALGRGSTSLKHRIARHLKKEKSLFWHIDYLLANQNVSVEAVLAAETKEKMECSVNSHIKSMLGAKVTVNGFGASDCRKKCESHLLYFPELDVDYLIKKSFSYLNSLEKIVSVYVVR